MDQNIQVMSRKVWHMVRVAFYMLRKGISKRKILMDLNLMTKRSGKIAGKAISNLMFHHHHHHHNHHDATTGSVETDVNPAPWEYEFSCSNTPLYRQYFPSKKSSKNHQSKNHYIPSPFDDGTNISMEAVSRVLETMVSNGDASVGTSPLLPGLGFGRSPMPTRQLRITDSPYPIQNGEEDQRVDQQAEDFIKRFYSQLKKQNY